MSERGEGHIYYLHQNGELICKRDLPGVSADLSESDLVRHWWRLSGNRADAWLLLVEAAALGVAPERIRDLAEKWGCDDRDAARFAEHLGLRLYMDGNAWCATFADFANLQESQAGFGTTALEALADLAKGGLVASRSPWARPRSVVDGWRPRGER